MKRSLHRTRRLLLGAVLLAAGTSASGLFSGHPAHAQLSVCYGDPLVFTDSGAKLRLQAAIQTDASNVQSITYVLHIPTGTSVTKVLMTGGKMGRLETLVPIADQAPGSYLVDTFVASTDDVPMTASASFHDQGWDTTSAGGMTNSDVLIAIQP